MFDNLAPSPVSPMIGIVTYLTEVESGRGAPDVFVAAARGPDVSAMGYTTGANIAGSGAGLRWDDARNAAVGECLERYAACAVHGDNLLAASFEALTRHGRDAHDPSAWALFDSAQHVPYPAFSKDRVITWSEGWDLATNEPIFLPACLVHLSSSSILRESGADVIGPGVSTGCACATSKSESLLKGLCELIERDAFLIVWRNRLPMPEVVIDKDAALYHLYMTKFARPGLEYRIWQTTLDFPMPSFFGIVFDRRGPKTRMIVGGAAHPDAELAVQKTLCELVQGLSWLEYLGEPDDDVPANFDEIRNFTDRARLYAFRELPDAYSFLLQDRDLWPLSSIPSRRAPAEELLKDCIAMVVGKGFRPAAIDLTTDDVRECRYVVTRVVVPGLETMDGDHRLQMLGGNRWRHVPAQLGFSSGPGNRTTLNPFPHPYP